MNNFSKHPERKDVVLPKKEYDKYYYDMEVKKVVKKTGEGEEDYVLVDKFIISRRNIEELINAQRGEVGVYNLLDRIAKTGDESLFPAEWKQEGIVDYTQMPKDLMEAVAVANNAENLYAQLPDELKGSSVEETLANLTDDQIKAYIASVKAKYQTQNEKKGENE